MECHLWTWCPANETDGCVAYDFCGGPAPGAVASTELLPAGTCILTYDPQHTASWGLYNRFRGLCQLAGRAAERHGAAAGAAGRVGAQPLAHTRKRGLCGGADDVRRRLHRCGERPAELRLLFAHVRCRRIRQQRSGSCGSGLTSCGGTFVDTLSDPSHCGSCAYACSDGQSCSYDSCM